MSDLEVSKSKKEEHPKEGTDIPLMVTEHALRVELYSEMFHNLSATLFEFEPERDAEVFKNLARVDPRILQPQYYHPMIRACGFFDRKPLKDCFKSLFSRIEGNERWKMAFESARSTTTNPARSLQAERILQALQQKEVFRIASLGYIKDAQTQFREAQKVLSQWGVADETAAAILSHPPAVRLLNSRVYSPILQEFASNAVQVRRVTSFIQILQLQKIEGVHHILQNQNILRAIAEHGGDDVVNITRMMESLIRREGVEAVARSTKTVTMIKEFKKWGGASPAQKWSLGIGVAFNGVACLTDILDAEEKKRQKEEVMKQLRSMLSQARFEYTDGTFVHKTGVTLSAKVLEQQLDGAIGAHYARAILNGASFLTSGGMLLFAPRLLMGPLGWTMMGVQIVVEKGIDVWNEQRMRDFMEDVPPSILALVGTEETVGKSLHELISLASHWMATDEIEASEARSEHNKKIIRRNALLVMCARELQSLPHDIAQEIILSSPDPNSILFSERTLGEGFEKILFPFITMRLFELSNDDTVKWSEFRQLKIQEYWDFENVSPEVLRTAVREGLLLYALHLCEKRRMKANMQRNEPLASLTDRDMVTYFEGERDAQPLRFLGMDVGGRDATIALREDGQTWTQWVLQCMQKNLKDHGPGTQTREDMRTSAGGRLFSIAVPEFQSAGRSPYVTPSDLVRAGYEGMEKANPTVLLYDRQVAMAKAFYGILEHVGEPGLGAWFAQPEHMTLLLNYALALEQVPDFDQSKKLRDAIYNLRQWDWERTLDTEYSGKRTAAFQSVIRMFARHMDWLEGERLTYHPYDRAKVQTHRESMLSITRYTNMFTTHSPELLVVIDGQEKVIGENGAETAVGRVVCKKLNPYRAGDSPTYDWNIENPKAGTVYMYTKDSRGREVRGTWWKIEQPEVCEVALPVGQDYMIFPGRDFALTLTLADGKTVEFSLGSAEWDRGTSVKAFQKKLAPYLEIEQVKAFNTRSATREPIGNLRTGKERSWEWSHYGWKLKKIPGSPVKAITIKHGSTDGRRGVLEGEGETVQGFESATAVQEPYRNPNGRRSGISVEAPSRSPSYLQLDTRHSGFQILHHRFNISLTLRGRDRSVKGTYDNPGRLHDHLDFFPRHLLLTRDQCQANGEPKEEYQGWDIKLRNPDAIESITFEFPNRAQVTYEFRSSPDT